MEQEINSYKQAIYVVLYLPEVRKVYKHNHDLYVAEIFEDIITKIAWHKKHALNFLDKYPNDFMGDKAEKLVVKFNRQPKNKRVYIAQTIMGTVLA